MSRKDFISDHLVDMRDQLRDSYTSYHQSRAGRETDAPAQNVQENVSGAVESAVKSVEKTSTPQPAEKYLPAMRRSDERDPDARERRDLEGRIIHDLAAIDSEREKLREKLVELEKFAAVLAESRQQIQHGDISKTGMTYFAARGRWSTFEQRYETAVAGEVPAATDRKGFWIVAAAVVLSSMIMAFALIKSLSV